MLGLAIQIGLPKPMLGLVSQIDSQKAILYPVILTGLLMLKLELVTLIGLPKPRLEPVIQICLPKSILVLAIRIDSLKSKLELATLTDSRKLIL